MKKSPSKVAHNRPQFFFQYCQSAQNQLKSHFLFHKNVSLRNFYIMTLGVVILLWLHPCFGFHFCLPVLFLEWLQYRQDAVKFHNLHEVWAEWLMTELVCNELLPDAFAFVARTSQLCFEIRQSTILYAGLLFHLDKWLVDQASDVPSIIFFP